MRPRQKLRNLLRTLNISAAERHQRNQLIADQLCLTSRHVKRADFDQIQAEDIRLLYELYDENYFAGFLAKNLNSQQISFRLSRRMTRAGGKTTRRVDRRRPDDASYEIAVSTTLLFQSFTDPGRQVKVTGLECDHRLDALMRVMEHELTHLCEMLVWVESSCARERFQVIASRFFGHTDHRHDLVTPRETASQVFGIRPGSRVRFRHEGAMVEGIVNRITRRATVLVPHAQGQPYSDGNRYLKLYIPLQQLECIQ